MKKDPAEKEQLKIFGNRIRELRKNRGLSQEQLGLSADLDRSYIGGVERGERNITLINIIKIAKAMEVDLIDIFKNLGSDDE